MIFETCILILEDLLYFLIFYKNLSYFKFLQVCKLIWSLHFSISCKDTSYLSACHFFFYFFINNQLQVLRVRIVIWNSPKSWDTHSFGLLSFPGSKWHGSWQLTLYQGFKFLCPLPQSFFVLCSTPNCIFQQNLSLFCMS